MVLDIKNHTDVVNNLTKSTIRTCEKYCTQLDNKVIQKSADYAKDHITTLNQEWENNQTNQAAKTFNFWKDLKSDITKSQSKLIETNRIAIKNNKILETKLNEAERRISLMKSELQQQVTEINKLETKIMNIGEDTSRATKHDQKILENETRTATLDKTIDNLT